MCFLRGDATRTGEGLLAVGLIRPLAAKAKPF
jgi:hypothetical protein